jgi:hypothetical protein
MTKNEVDSTDDDYRELADLQHYEDGRCGQQAAMSADDAPSSPGSNCGRQLKHHYEFSTSVEPKGLLQGAAWRAIYLQQICVFV